MKQIRKVLLSVLTLIATTSNLMCGAYAEEGGSGAYTPGSDSSVMDGMLSKPGFITRLNVFYYNGENRIRCIPPACTDIADVSGTAKAASLTTGWRPDLTLGKNWSFMMSATIPVVSLDITADVPRSGPGSTRFTGDAQGLGDLQLYPAIAHYAVNQDFTIGGRIAIFAPTGEYDADRLANFGKNYWSFMPSVNFMYWGSKSNFEASLFLAANFNTENEDTSYTSGTQAHAEYTLKQHKPFYKGLVGYGVTGHFYEQIAADRGAGAVYGDYKAHVYGVGPIVTYLGELAGQNVAVELKWVHDYEAQNRFSGDTVLLKYGIIF